MFSERDPLRLRWADLGVDIVIESTELFTKAELAAKHVEAGARKVVISAPATGDDGTFVLGVNEHTYDRVIGDQVKVSAWYDNEWGSSRRSDALPRMREPRSSPGPVPPRHVRLQRARRARTARSSSITR